MAKDVLTLMAEPVKMSLSTVKGPRGGEVILVWEG